VITKQVIICCTLKEEVMNINKLGRMTFVFALIVFLPILTLARLQGPELKQSPPQTDPVKAASAVKPEVPPSRETRSDDGVVNEVEQLRKAITQLQTIVEQQGRILSELKQQLDEAKTTAANGAATFQPVKADLDSQPSTSAAGNGPTPGSSSQTQAKEQKPAALLAGWDNNHAFLRSPNGNFVTNLTGYAQLDFRGYQAGNHPANTFLVRRARVALEGKVAQYYDFKVEGDFADTTSTLLRDFYVRVHRKDQFQITAGQFKEPFSQEELRSDAYTDFVERSLPDLLAPSRSPGVMISGLLRKGTIEYYLGAFNGKGLLANNTVGTPEGVMRLRFSPWKNTKEFWLNGLSFGGAYAQGRNAPGATSIRGQTESRSFTFFAPDTVNGASIRANGELTWLLGPASIRAEYDQVNQARTALGAKGTNLPGVVSKGYMAQFTYLLTGEKKPDSGAVAPKNNLFGDSQHATGFGAWEIKVRYSNLGMFDGTAKSNHAGTFFFGPNWYLNRFVRYVLDLGVERFGDPARTPRPGDRHYFVVLSRVQLAF
jgi:phosphate-selective porin OprO/OprP